MFRIGARHIIGRKRSYKNNCMLNYRVKCPMPARFSKLSKYMYVELQSEVPHASTILQAVCVHHVCWITEWSAPCQFVSPSFLCTLVTSCITSTAAWRMGGAYRRRRTGTSIWSPANPRPTSSASYRLKTISIQYWRCVFMCIPWICVTWAHVHVFKR